MSLLSNPQSVFPIIYSCTEETFELSILYAHFSMQTLIAHDSPAHLFSPLDAAGEFIWSDSEVRQHLSDARASTPQLGATLLSQRLCTFILQTEDRKMKGEGMRTYSVFQRMLV